ncbi:MAG: hypothetical protein KBB70_01015 [Candidatus Pacebacteria bacterium]|nr:hypothetical protein [Candidatus Paceibacterota bacterium]
MNRYNFGFGFWFGLIIVVLFGGVLFFMFNQESSKRSFLSTAPTHEIALTCTTDMATTFHIHPVLTIMFDGVKQVIPTNVGIVDGCMNPLHTHDDLGTLHVESPVQRDFTLGDFFTVWKQPFSKTQILDKTVTGAGSITMTINGKPVDTFENTVLVDADQIVINYKSN